ncbi:MAG: chromosomal replication initiator protein DnaA, partial [Verrucomicrobiae bacterium]|nr:chromosomal replication initiator protein DnaA [Verrucomicrobiae bacterium]
MQPLAFEGEILTLGVVNNLKQIWLEDNYTGLLNDLLEKKFGRKLLVRFSNLADREPEEVREESALEEFAVAAKIPETAPASRKGAVADRGEGGLRSRNVFDNFVVGSNNEFAHAAAMAVAQSPARAYNPLFIYGGVGLG